MARVFHPIFTRCAIFNFQTTNSSAKWKNIRGTDLRRLISTFIPIIDPKSKCHSRRRNWRVLFYSNCNNQKSREIVTSQTNNAAVRRRVVHVKYQGEPSRFFVVSKRFRHFNDLWTFFKPFQRFWCRDIWIANFGETSAFELKWPFWAVLCNQYDQC